eukprot:gene838-biopygen106
MKELQESVKQIKLSERREEEEQLLSAKQRQLEIESELEKAKFWNQFEAEIDRVKIDSVTKFSYLKELLLSKNLTALPVVKGGSPAKTHDFDGKLMISVQALESMGKLKEINGLTRATLDKLEGIRAELVRTDDNWQEWGFPQLINALREWTERNPMSLEDKGTSTNIRETIQGSNHRAVECRVKSGCQGLVRHGSLQLVHFKQAGEYYWKKTGDSKADKLT